MAYCKVTHRGYYVKIRTKQDPPNLSVNGASTYLVLFNSMYVFTFCYLQQLSGVQLLR